MLKGLLKDASRQIAGVPYVDIASGEMRSAYNKPAASIGTVSIRSMEIPGIQGRADYQIQTPINTEAGKKTLLADAVIASSRVAEAGAHIVVIPAAEKAIPVGEELVFQSENAGFATIEAANFSLAPDGTDLTDSAIQVYRAYADRKTIPAYGVRIPMSRSEQKSYREGELADSVLVSIALGVSRAADAALLGAIKAANPAAFSLAAAAAKGLKFHELRSLVGTAGTGAAVGQDGALRVAGVQAELTPDIDATIVGAFNRSAVAIHEEITLLAERINVQGALVLTCWVHLQALLPKPDSFFSVGA